MCDSLQQLIELNIAAVIAADRQERRGARIKYINGYRPRLLSARVGDIEFMLTEQRIGGFLHPILESAWRGQDSVLRSEGG